MTKYDDEIREVESRLERNRVALRVEAENLTSTARRVAASPKGLMIAAVAGFAFGELTAPRRRRPASRETRDHSAPQAAKAIGIGGLLGSAALTFIRQRYGSPWVIANRAWHYYQMQKRSRTEATSYGRARPSSSAAMVRPAATGPVAPAPRPRVHTDPGLPTMQRDGDRKTHATS